MTPAIAEIPSLEPLEVLPRPCGASSWCGFTLATVLSLRNLGRSVPEACDGPFASRSATLVQRASDTGKTSNRHGVSVSRSNEALQHSLRPASYRPDE